MSEVPGTDELNISPSAQVAAQCPDCTAPADRPKLLGRVGVVKPVDCRTFRHSFTTHLPEGMS